MVSFRVFFESRFSDREYNNPNAAWRLTVDEYLKASNKSGKHHSSDAYQPRSRKTVTRENPPIKDTIKISADDPRGKQYRTVEWTDSKGQKRSYGGLQSFQVGDPDSHVDHAYDYLLQHASGDIIDTKETIQYHFQDNPNYTTYKFPYKIETHNGVEYRYDKNDKTLMAFIDGKAIGMASDEWGAYLVQVDPNYHGKGIGSKLAHIYQAINKKDSGGYTNQGYNMAISLHKKAVQDAIKLGWYKKAIADGSLSEDKVNEIIN